MMEFICLRDQPFDPYAELSAFTALLDTERQNYGAESHFIGTMRNFNEGDAVSTLWLEHYPGMTEQEIARIVSEERKQLNFGPALVIHRIGKLAPGEPIVLIAVFSAHRRAALDGTQRIIERLKHEAPFWKKEHTPDGERWVASNTKG
jgi:molybdopterin synthase catalytic subunit